eukprot:639070-Amphidinium_carterae.2
MEQIKDDVEIVDDKECCGFDTFVEIADRTRLACAERRARYAGLRHDQVTAFRTYFDMFHKEGEDVVGAQALSELMERSKRCAQLTAQDNTTCFAQESVGFELKTKEQQLDIVQKLDAAKSAAIRAGVPEHELDSKEGTSHCRDSTLWGCA